MMGVERGEWDKEAACHAAAVWIMNNRGKFKANTGVGFLPVEQRLCAEFLKENLQLFGFSIKTDAEAVLSKMRLELQRMFHPDKSIELFKIERMVSIIENHGVGKGDFIDEASSFMRHFKEFER